MGEICSNGATWGTRAVMVRSCAQSPDGSDSSQAKMEAGSEKALGMPSTSERQEPGPGRPGALREDWLPREIVGPAWAKGLVPTHPDRASLDLSTKSPAQCLNPVETGKPPLIMEGLTWPPTYGQLRPLASAGTHGGQGMKQVIRSCVPELGC